MSKKDLLPIKYTKNVRSIFNKFNEEDLNKMYDIAKQNSLISKENSLKKNKTKTLDLSFLNKKKTIDPKKDDNKNISFQEFLEKK